MADYKLGATDIGYVALDWHKDKKLLPEFYLEQSTYVPTT